MATQSILAEEDCLPCCFCVPFLFVVLVAVVRHDRGDSHRYHHTGWRNLVPLCIVGLVATGWTWAFASLAANNFCFVLGLIRCLDPTFVGEVPVVMKVFLAIAWMSPLVVYVLGVIWELGIKVLCFLSVEMYLLCTIVLKACKDLSAEQVGGVDVSCAPLIALLAVILAVAEGSYEFELNKKIDKVLRLEY
jgi:hypothetical protein